MPDATRFVVRRLNWRPAGDRFIRLLGETRVASFDSFDAAEAYRAGRELDVRGRLNPFRCGTAFYTLTTLPEVVFCDWVADAGLTPPERPAVGFADWVGWWETASGAWSDEQRARVWDGLNRVRFFEVIERPPSAVAYAVVRVMWAYNDQWEQPGSEGGRTVAAYRSRESAEKRRAELDAEARRAWGGTYLSARRWQLENWPALGEDVGTPFKRAFDELGVPLYEVVEIDLDGMTP